MDEEKLEEVKESLKKLKRIKVAHKDNLVHGQSVQVSIGIQNKNSLMMVKILIILCRDLRSMINQINY